MIRPNMESDAPAAGTLRRHTDRNDYGSKTSQDGDTQQPLATQLPPRFPSPARPSSRDSMRSQNDDQGEHSAPVSESQNGLSTQFDPVNPRHKMSIAAITEPSAPSTMLDRKSLLQCLTKRTNPTNSTKPQTSRVAFDSSSGGTKGASPSDSITIRKDNDGKIETISRGDPSDDAELSSQGQVTTFDSPQPQTAHVQNSITPLKEQPNPISAQSQEEITSFQRVPTSPTLNTSPIAAATESLTRNVKTDSNISDFRSTEMPETKSSSDRGLWNNITKLASRDVAIPKDQEEFLDRPDCWIPADVSQPTPQGHVPTALLQEWNAKMSRLFHEKRINASSQNPTSSPQREEGGTPPSLGAGRRSEDESDSDSDAMDWSQSPIEHLKPARERAPPDSPIRQQGNRRSPEIPEQDVNKIARVVDEIPNKSNPDTLLSTPSPSPITHPIDPTQETSVSRIDQTQNSTLSHAQYSTADDPSNDTKLEGEIVESSDESDMETSIPQALTTGSQNIASQPASSELTAPVSSNSPSAPSTRLHVLDTPAAALKRATSKLIENARRYISNQSSSDDNNKSSQVIANSVDSTGNAPVREPEIDYTQKSLVEDSQHTNGDSYDSSLPSHQDSQRIEVVPESSLNSADLHTQGSIRNDETPKEQTDHSSDHHSSDPLAAMVSGATLKRKAQELQSKDESPSKRPRQVIDRDMDSTSTQITIYSEHRNPYEDRHKHIFSATPDGPLRIFEMFKKSYPKYVGDFDHFRNLCGRLQSLRGRGMLQKCFLWDEFVMRHLLDYRAYVYARSSANRHWENYEEYFCNKFFQPFFKQRSLTHRALNIIAPEHQPLAKVITSISRETQTAIDDLASVFVTNQLLFTEDPRNEATLGNQSPPSSTSDAMVIVDKPTQANIGVKLSSLTPINNRPSMIDASIQVTFEVPTPLSFQRNEDSAEVRNGNITIEETQPQICINDGDDDEEMSEDEGTRDGSIDNNNHETASVELGVEPSERGDGNGNYDHDYDEDARIDLISRIQRENHQAVHALRSTTIPQPPEDSTHLDEDTPFKVWVRDCERFSSEKDGTSTGLKQEKEEEGPKSWNPFKRPSIR